MADAGVGVRVARGGALRVLGHGAGSLLAAVSSVVLLRHLGPAEFGAYATVTAFLAVALALGDGGLTTVGQREWGLREGEAARAELLGRLVAARLVLVPVAVGVATAVAVVAASRDVVVGVLVGGVGLLLHVVGATLTVPMLGRLRFGRAVGVELARTGGLAAGVVVLVLLGARMPAVVLGQVVAGAAALGVAAALLGGLVRPRWRGVPGLLTLALPVGLAGLLHAAQLAVPVLAAGTVGPTVAGLVGASQRVVEAVGAVGLLAVGAALPVLVARAGDADDERATAERLQPLVEAAALLGGTAALALVVAAGPVVVALGGEEYAAAEPVLRVHALVLALQPVALVALLALVAAGRRRALVVVHLVALLATVLAAAAAVPGSGAGGAALAALVGEAVLVVCAVAALVRSGPAAGSLRAAVPRLLRVALALGLGAAAATLLPAPDLLRAAVAVLVVLATATAVGAVPPVLREAARAGLRR